MRVVLIPLSMRTEVTPQLHGNSKRSAFSWRVASLRIFGVRPYNSPGTVRVPDHAQTGQSDFFVSRDSSLYFMRINIVSVDSHLCIICTFHQPDMKEHCTCE